MEISVASVAFGLDKIGRNSENEMAIKTVRTKDGRYITIDTETGKEEGIFEGNLKFVKDAADAVGLTTLPSNLPGMIERLGEDIRNLPGAIGPNLVYSDEVDHKGRPLTLAQKANRDKALSNFMKGGKGGIYDTEAKGSGTGKVIEVTGADGNPVRLDMNNPADVERLQGIQPKVAPSTENVIPPSDPPAPERSNMADKSELERMTAFVKANRGLAEKVKPGQAVYEEIQIALGRMPFMPDEVQTFKSTDEGVTNPADAAKAAGIDKLYDAQVPVAAVDPQEFANNAVMKISDALKMESVLPNNAKLAEAYAASVPETVFFRPTNKEIMGTMAADKDYTIMDENNFGFVDAPIMSENYFGFKDTSKGLNLRTGARQ